MSKIPSICAAAMRRPDEVLQIHSVFCWTEVIRRVLFWIYEICTEHPYEDWDCLARIGWVKI